MRALILAFVAALLVATPAQAAFPGPNGKIAFEKSADIYTVNPDGTGLTNLTNSGVAERMPAWSADGTKLAFVSSGRHGAGDEVYVMDADGSDVRKVTSSDCGAAYNPAWSPDGQRIAYDSSCHVDGRAIYSITVDGTDVDQLTSGTTQDSAPSWSPDGTKIAFAHVNGNRSSIYVMNPDGTGQVPVVDIPFPFSAGIPDWSPDGTRLAFSSNLDSSDPNNDSDVYAVNADGTGLTRLTSALAREYAPVWSPDGSRIAYHRVTSCNI
jgi:Tol biopolymer transport system component